MAEWRKGDYWITNDRIHFDLDVIYKFLSSEAYWSRNIPRPVVQKSVENSLGFGLFHKDQQVGFARIISDLATIAYLGDVFVLPEFRGRGLSKWLMECIVSHPDLQSLRRWILLTGDAHGLYRQYGFTELASPVNWMERHDPNVYQAKS